MGRTEVATERVVGMLRQAVKSDPVRFAIALFGGAGPASGVLLVNFLICRCPYARPRGHGDRSTRPLSRRIVTGDFEHRPVPCLPNTGISEIGMAKVGSSDQAAIGTVVRSEVTVSGADDGRALAG